MCRCYLSQHGLALDKQQDVLRPLSVQGREDIARVAGFLSLFTRPDPAVIYCSDKLRAQQSAAMFAEGWKIGDVRSESGFAPNASVSPMLEQIGSSDHDLMLVGHQPYLTTLASHLLLGRGDGTPVCFANGGVLCLQRNSLGWQVCWQVNPTMFYPA